MTDLNSDSKLQPDPDVLTTELEGEGGPEAVLLSLTTQRYFSLNPTGLRIWNLLGEGFPLGDVAHRLTEEYDVGAERAEGAVLALSEALLEQRLARLKQS
jgi:hypothetical protein